MTNFLSLNHRDVIEDKDFLDSLDRIKSEATPYFSMIPEVYEQDPATTNNQPGDKNIPEVDVPVVETDDSVEAEEASPLVNDKLDRLMDVQEESDTTKATSEDIEVAVIKSAKMTTDTDMCFLNEINARQYLKRYAFSIFTMNFCLKFWINKSIYFGLQNFWNFEGLEPQK